MDVRNPKKDARQLRKESTPSEMRLWQGLRSRQFLELKFRRQHPIKGYIVDFCCTKLKIVIEVDGDVHCLEENKIRDRIRQSVIERAGYQMIRYTSKDVMENFDGVMESLALALL